jgi:hypothetical protein
MAQNQAHFEQTVAEMKGLNVSSQKAINLITGGDSYIYFECAAPIGGPTEIDSPGAPKGVMGATCWSVLVGSYPLQAHATFFGPMGMREIEYGTIYPHELGRPRPGFSLMFYPAESKGPFTISITAANGNYSQSFIVRKIGEKWLWGAHLYKYMGNKAKLIKVFGAPGFPRELLNADWNKLE